MCHIQDKGPGVVEGCLKSATGDLRGDRRNVVPNAIGYDGASTGQILQLRSNREFQPATDHSEPSAWCWRRRCFAHGLAGVGGDELAEFGEHDGVGRRRKWSGG